MINSIKNKKKYIFNSYQFGKDNLIPNTFKDVKFLNKEFNLMILSLILDFNKYKSCKKLLNIKEHPNYTIKQTVLEKILSKFITYFPFFSKTK